MEANNSISIKITDENGSVLFLDGVLSVDIPKINAFECGPAPQIVGSGSCKIVISDESREKLMISIGCKVMVEDALMQLAEVFKTGNESIKILAEELKKIAVERDKQRDKPKPAKPYWRIGERW